MEVNKELLKKKLDVLKNYLRQIQQMDFTEEDLVDNVDIQQLLSFRLQQAVETAIDIATHIVAGHEFPRQESARSVFILLGKKGLIDEETADNLALACSFRNMIVHVYQEIDFSRVYYDYKEDVKDLEAFSRMIYEQFIKK
jgi:uncharacterized protein YutE (UPF0331/DUF86 family)